MPEKEKLTPEEHKLQITRYTDEKKNHYDTYAAALKRVLQKACEISIPEAFVQSRSKTVSSFAEKAVRKFDKYPDAVNQMTDLCGARIIVQTIEQVKAVKQFIEANFEKIEKEDKGLLLHEDEFGYRDMHYIVQLKPVMAESLGFTPEEIAVIGNRRAEIQVRTWVQHAWADTLHDRMYKTKLKYPPEFKRTGALLAAIMEEGDRAFDRLALEIDGMLVNYTTYARKEDVRKEIAIHELIFAHAGDEKKPGIALQLARLVAASGDYERVVRELEPHKDTQGPLRCEILLELGHALCKVNRTAPKSPDYRRGQACLSEVVTYCECGRLDVVPNERKCRSIHARALARVAWSKEVVPGEEFQALDDYHKALEAEPANPYYLADALGYDAHVAGNTKFVSGMATTLREAVRTCNEHVVNGTELPYACFTAGRLHLLLNEACAALACYARGIRHMLAGTNCVPSDVLDAEIAWVLRMNGANPLSGGSLWVRDMLELAMQVAGVGDTAGEEPAGEKTVLRAPVLIVAGGAASLDATIVERLRPMLCALEGFRGTVVAGGTTVGIPGCVGDIAGELASRGTKEFHLVGYIPHLLPHDAPQCKRYDRHVTCGEQGFSSGQIIRNWRDILASGIDPKTVLLLGVGGGPLSSVEYRIALALGASVAVVQESGGAAEALIEDPWWTGVPNLLIMPFDAATIRSFMVPSHTGFDDMILDAMAQAFHTRYVEGSTGRLPANMRPWPELDTTFKVANREQARYAVAILTACGFAVRSAANPAIFSEFTDKEVERMAEMEHGRWNVERLRDGWRPGQSRDDAGKIHNCLVPWSTLPEGIKDYDRNAVLKFPEILAKAGLEVCRV